LIYRGRIGCNLHCAERRLYRFYGSLQMKKVYTNVFLLALIAVYDNMSSNIWIYTAMQGSYGLVWIIKDTALPDPSWQRRITIGGGINAFIGVLGWY